MTRISHFQPVRGGISGLSVELDGALRSRSKCNPFTIDMLLHTISFYMLYLPYTYATVCDVALFHVCLDEVNTIIYCNVHNAWHVRVNLRNGYSVVIIMVFIINSNEFTE